MKTPQLITARKQVETNVHAYHDALDNLQSFTAPVQRSILNTLSHTQAWFCMQRGGRWLAAPVKFIGFTYDDGPMTAPVYNDFRTVLSGTKASERVSDVCGWLPMEHSHPARVEIYQKSIEMNKPLRSGAAFYLFGGENLPVKDRRAVDGLVEIIERASLSKEALEYMLGRIEKVAA
jgi:hypothetical protein